MRLSGTISILSAALTLTGCISSVTVKQIARNDVTTRGLRYSLPATFLLVQPQADGTATYNWVYLPDPDKTYVIQKTSFLAKFTLDVATSNGLLTSVEAQGDSTGVAAKLFDAAQSVYSAKVGADAKAARTDPASIASAKAALAAAKLSDDQAHAEQAIVNADSNASTSDKRAAAIKVADADLALSQAQATVTAADASFDIAGANATPRGLTRQYGPILFRVVQEDGHVSLLAMNNQGSYDTVTAQTATPGSPGAGVSGKFMPSLAPEQKLLVGENLKLRINFSDAIVDLDVARSNLVRDHLPVTARMTRQVAADGKSAIIIFPDGLPAGSYSLVPALIETPGGGPRGAPAAVDFTVVAH